jgi:hypothetical protein
VIIYKSDKRQGGYDMRKTFAQLKRDLQVGVKVKTLYNYCKPEKEGEVRTVGKQQTNAICFDLGEGRLSYLWWPEKASQNVEYEDNVFKVFDAPAKWNNNTRTLAFAYEIIA